MPLDLGEVLPEGKLYYRIGEVSRITGVKAYVLRYWESEFRWMAPQKSRSKQRLYRRKDIETILLIRRLLYEERYTIAGARQRLRELGSGKASSTGKPGKPGKSGKSGDSSSPSESSRPAATPERVSEAGADAASWAAAQADYRGRFQRIKQELALIRASL
jgi:DNA-binding transcriptional MerR regulator